MSSAISATETRVDGVLSQLEASVNAVAQAARADTEAARAKADSEVRLVREEMRSQHAQETAETRIQLQQAR